ncbi:MAG TPA: hypothetical protein VFD63_05660, partial [Pyrinomonadaceae bacterium]|nr:hypothetical protein [Pyrinomonadaceae bacterium]
MRLSVGDSYDGETAASLLGRIIHLIREIPSADASIVISPTLAPSREMTTQGWELASVVATVTPVQKCGA